MKDRLSALFMASALVLIVRLYPFGNVSGVQSANVYSLGFVILAGYLLGEILSRIHLPRITGYLFAGLLIGPFGGGAISHSSVQDFLLINQIALTLIALTAGGELRIQSLKDRWKDIAILTVSQTLACFILGSLNAYFLLSMFTWPSAFPSHALGGISCVIGLIAVSQSPATAIAVITETRSKGICTEVVLGIAIVLDILVIILFTCILMMLGTMDHGTGALQWTKLVVLAEEITFSIGMGILAGIGLSIYLSRFKSDPILFLLAFCFLISVGAKSIHLDPLLVCVAAGIWVTNASRQGKELIETIESGSLIIYVIFFCVAGASLDLGALARMWPLALLLVGSRMLILWFSTWMGIRIARAPIPSVHTYWMAFLPQAGVSLGLVAVLANEGFSWVDEVRTLVVACIAINQILGPILMKFALTKSGETHPAKSASSRGK